jgi:hypothetical protein
VLRRFDRGVLVSILDRTFIAEYTPAAKFRQRADPGPIDCCSFVFLAIRRYYSVLFSFRHCRFRVSKFPGNMRSANLPAIDNSFADGTGTGELPT